MTHKKNTNMYLKMLDIEAVVKKQFQGILAIMTLNESTKIFICHIIYFIKETSSFWFKTLCSDTNGINRIVTIITAIWSGV